MIRAIHRNNGLVVKGFRITVQKSRFEKAKSNYNSKQLHKDSMMNRPIENKVWKPTFRDNRSYKEVLSHKESTIVEVPRDSELEKWLGHA